MCQRLPLSALEWSLPRKSGFTDILYVIHVNLIVFFIRTKGSFTLFGVYALFSVTTPINATEELYKLWQQSFQSLVRV